MTLSPLQPLKQVCRGAVLQGLGCPRQGAAAGAAGVLWHGGVGTGGAGSSGRDAAPCPWRGSQPARSCPAILEQRAPAGRVFCPDLAAGAALRGPVRRHRGRAPAALPARLLGTDTASFCLFFISLCLALSVPLCFLSLSCRRVSALSRPLSRACLSPRRSCAHSSQCQDMAPEKHGKNASEKTKH